MLVMISLVREKGLYRSGSCDIIHCKSVSVCRDLKTPLEKAVGKPRNATPRGYHGIEFS